MTDSSTAPHRPVGVMILPSVLTVAALCAGLTGVRFAADGKVDLALMLVVIAAILISALTGLLTFDNLASTVTVAASPARTSAARRPGRTVTVLALDPTGPCSRCAGAGTRGSPRRRPPGHPARPRRR